MKRYIFFQWIFLCLLISINAKLNAQNITYPVNGTVFQQNLSGQATVNFSFAEHDTYNRTIFYRIKKADGTVVKTEIDLFQISPNPNNGNFGIQIDAPTAGQMQFYLSRSNGGVLHSFTHTVTEGINQKAVEIPNLLPGVYLLTGQLGEVIQTKRLVIE